MDIEVPDSNRGITHTANMLNMISPTPKWCRDGTIKSPFCIGCHVKSEQVNKIDKRSKVKVSLCIHFPQWCFISAAQRSKVFFFSLRLNALARKRVAQMQHCCKQTVVRHTLVVAAVVGGTPAARTEVGLHTPGLRKRALHTLRLVPRSLEVAAVQRRVPPKQEVSQRSAAAAAP